MRPAWFACLVLAAASAQTFKVSVDAVRLDVLVTDGRRPIAGLTSGDFDVRDRGVVQRIDAISLEDVPLSVMLALDTSSSIRGTPLVRLKQAAAAVVQLFEHADRGALMTFGEALALDSPWTSDRQGLLAAIERADAGGSTPLHDATYAALTLRDPQPGRTLILIFSDGADTSSWLSGDRALDIARRNDAVVYAVTMLARAGRIPGYRLDFHSGFQVPVRDAPAAVLMQPFLDALADETGGKVIGVERLDHLRETFVQIVTEFRSRYVLTYTPRGVEGEGWHPIEVKVKGHSAKVTARRGYLR